MPNGERLLAWVKPREGEGYVASFVAAHTVALRPPATHQFPSPVEAKAWVERQATELGIPVEWTDQPAVRRT